MATKLASMTTEEFEEFFSDILERKLLELLVDPDKDLPLQEFLVTKLRLVTPARQALLGVSMRNSSLPSSAW